MKTMIVADANLDPGLGCGALNRAKLRRIERSRFLNEHMLAGLDRRKGERRE